MLDKFLPFKIDNHLKKNNFIPIDSFDRVGDWSGSDTRELYRKNLKTQPQDWYYRINPVKYTNNSKGYRTAEFDKIKWAESIVIFGCSNVYGVGVDDPHTLSQQLENILQIPVINLGQGGTSINFNLHNSVMLADGYPTPKAVIMGWPSYDRCVSYNRTGVDNYGSWNFEKNNYMDLWTKDKYNPRANAVMAQKIFQLIWKNRTATYEYSFDSGTAELLGFDRTFEKIKNIDFARDLLHPGPDAIRKTAEIISASLQNKI
jgi:hypothetical protein